MTTGTAKHRGEEIDVDFTAAMMKSDYGVDRSPVWYEPEDIEIDALTILGVEVDAAKLPKELRNAILDLADDLEFEVDHD